MMVLQMVYFVIYSSIFVKNDTFFCRFICIYGYFFVTLQRISKQQKERVFLWQQEHNQVSKVTVIVYR